MWKFVYGDNSEEEIKIKKVEIQIRAEEDYEKENKIQDEE